MPSIFNFMQVTRKFAELDALVSDLEARLMELEDKAENPAPPKPKAKPPKKED